MWTPRRILLLVAGFATFFCSFHVYAFFLGGIDGLPPLPEDYWPQSVQSGVDLPPLPVRENEAERKLRLAFGEDEKVKNCSVKLEIRARGLVLATEQVQPEKDGRVKLTPFFIAIFGKDKGEGGYREINTIRSREAYLTFDRPVTQLMEMSNRKVLAGELIHDIMIVNNRGTAQQNDDISVFTQGPLYYDESRHLVFTKADVRLTDPKCQPEPITITGTGLDMILAADSKPQSGGTGEAAAAKGMQSPGAKRQKVESVSGVERIRLLADVNMNLWVDSDSGFLGSGKHHASATDKKQAVGTQAKPSPTTGAVATAGVASKPAGLTGPIQPPERAKVVIITQGPFLYDLLSNQAVFDISQHPSPRPNYVEVTRVNGSDGKREHLVCDHLQLQFKKKDESAKQAGNGDQLGLEILSAHATGQQVTLTSDAENLDAFGVDLFYDAVKRTSVLKGDPEMVAAKDGNEIYAKELRMHFLGSGIQEVTAKGPGRINMLDREKGERNLHARWKDELVSSKEGVYDLLTLKGEASFDDTEHGQRIQADLLKVWLEPTQRDGEKKGQSPSNSRLARQLEAIGHVSATAPDLRVRDTDRLAIWFKNITPAVGQLPAALPSAGAAAANSPDRASVAPQSPASAPAPAPLPQFIVPGSAPAPPPPVAAVVGAPKNSLNPASKPAPGVPAKPPIDLKARSVEAYVLRSGARNDLEKLWCEGGVHVHQDPGSPEDKGVDIRGETMQLTHFLDGNVLTVTGDLAEVQLDKLSIQGPEVNIDQKSNKAWVQGIGAMRMPSSSTFDGKKLTKTVDMTVFWNKNMHFDGQKAEFHGGVQADQENAHLLCQSMQVTLDRVVSLREGEKGKQPAKVQTLLCDRDVDIVDKVAIGNNRFQYKRITCMELNLDNDKGDDSFVNAPGPGEVRIHQPGARGDMPGFGGPAPAAQVVARPAGAAGNANNEEMKLTWVRFAGKMFASNQSRTAIFYDNVEVVHVPTELADLQISLDKPAPGQMYLSCGKLQVFTSKHLDGKTTQEMNAYTKVFVQGQDYWGRANEVHYDEAKNLIVFIGADGIPASLDRIKVRGSQPETIKGGKIYFWRGTGQVKVENARELNLRN